MDKYEEIARIFDAACDAGNMSEDMRTAWMLAREVKKLTDALGDYCKVCMERDDMKRIAGLTEYIGMMRYGLEQFIEIQKKIFENGD